MIPLHHYRHQLKMISVSFVETRMIFLWLQSGLIALVSHFFLPDIKGRTQTWTMTFLCLPLIFCIVLSIKRFCINTQVVYMAYIIVFFPRDVFTGMKNSGIQSVHISCFGPGPSPLVKYHMLELRLISFGCIWWTASTTPHRPLVSHEAEPMSVCMCARWSR